MRAGDTLDRRKAGVEASPQRIVVDQRGDLALEAALLALEQDDDLVEAGERSRRRLAAVLRCLLMVSRRHLREPGNQSLEPLLAGLGGGVGRTRLTSA